VEGCQLYAQAAERAQQDERTISMDELTGVQALERKHPDLPMFPGHVLRREFEYIRHGTLSWYINLDVATGQIIEPSWGPTRGEQDCLAHLKRLIESAPEVKRWHVMMDNLDTHRSEALVRWIAELESRKRWASKARKAFCVRWPAAPRSCTIPRIGRCFITRAIHASWMNQVEIWLSILVRKLLKRSNFPSLDDLRDQILAFIDYYNRTMAKPIKWTYTGLSPDRGVI